MALLCGIYFSWKAGICVISLYLETVCLGYEELGVDLFIFIFFINVDFHFNQEDMELEVFSDFWGRRH